MRSILTAFFAAALLGTAVRANDEIRTGTPKDCFLYSWGKGPNWTTSISSEFRLSLLNRQMPYVDEGYSDPTDKALTWIERTKEPSITTLATVIGRKIVQIVYPETGSVGKTIGMILLAIETTKGSDWYSPFFAAQPELYRGQFVSGADVTFGYIATLESSGTGSYRTHYVFNLHEAHPKIVSTLSAGRVVRPEYESDAAYEEAKKVFEREEALFSGLLQANNPTQPEK